MPCSLSLCRCDHLPSFLQSCIALDITLDYNTATENAKQLRKVSYCIIAQDFTDFLALRASDHYQCPFLSTI